jgi:hypothetical protein
MKLKPPRQLKRRNRRNTVEVSPKMNTYSAISTFFTSMVQNRSHSQTQDQLLKLEEAR